MSEPRHSSSNPRAVLLDIAAELRANPAAWGSGYFGRTPEGIGVDSWHPRAICWCLTGHINKRAPDPSSHGSRAAFGEPVRQLLYPLVEGDIIGWNDKKGRIVEDVIALCEEAAA